MYSVSLSEDCGTSKGTEMGSDMYVTDSGFITFPQVTVAAPNYVLQIDELRSHNFSCPGLKMLPGKAFSLKRVYY